MSKTYRRFNQSEQSDKVKRMHKRQHQNESTQQVLKQFKQTGQVLS